MRNSKKRMDSTSPTEVLSEDQIGKTIEQFRNLLHSEEDMFGITPWFLHTGNLALDYIISGKVDGTGGYPAGQIIEVFGPPSTGKTLLIAKAAAELQKVGGIACVADIERRWNREFVALHGVDPNQLVVYPPDSVTTVEGYCVRSDELLSSVPQGTKVGLFLDSVAALSTLQELKDVGTKADQGRKAQRIRAMLRVLPTKLKELGAIFIVANHVTANVGDMYGPKMTTSGGTGFTFHSTVRVELLTTKPIKIEGKLRPIGVVMRCKVAKNSIQPPYGECNVRMYWSTGVQKYSGLLELAQDNDIVTMSGGWWNYGDHKFRATDLASFIGDHPEFLSDPRWTQPYFKVAGEGDAA